MARGAPLDSFWQAGPAGKMRAAKMKTFACLPIFCFQGGDGTSFSSYFLPLFENLGIGIIPSIHQGGGELRKLGASRMVGGHMACENPSLSAKASGSKWLRFYAIGWVLL